MCLRCSYKFKAKKQTNKPTIKNKQTNKQTHTHTHTPTPTHTHTHTPTHTPPHTHPTPTHTHPHTHKTTVTFFLFLSDEGKKVTITLALDYNRFFNLQFHIGLFLSGSSNLRKR